MAVNFPSNPDIDDIYVFEGRTYRWDGVKWVNITSLDLAGKYVGEIIDSNNNENYKIWIGEGDEYTELEEKDPNTIYFTTFTPIKATGGTVTDIEIDGEDYRVHAFTDVGEDEFEVQDLGTENKIDVLVVAGGGQGGYAHRSGGGGGGGLIFENSMSLSVSSYEISVGGTTYSNSPVGSNGEDSKFGDLIAIGGGRGGDGGSDGEDVSGGDGGSGGGSSAGSDPGSGVEGQGHDGGLGLDQNEWRDRTGGGGGGAGEPGHNGEFRNGGDGGDGLYFGDVFTNSFGENGWFAGGGGGSVSEDGEYAGQGGKGGGADASVNGPPQDAKPNTGGGGSGTNREYNNIPGGHGGSGIILIRYKI